MKHPRCDSHPMAWEHDVAVPVHRPCERCLLETLLDGQTDMKQSVTELNAQITAMQGSLTTLAADLTTLEAVVTQTDDPDVVAAVKVLTDNNAQFAALVSRLTVDVSK